MSKDSPRVYPVFSPAARAYRRLAKNGLLPAYRECSHLGDVPQIGAGDSPLEEDEVLLGVYENVRGSKEDLLLFTDCAVHWPVVGGWQALRYREIRDIPLQEGAKMELAEVKVLTTHGDIVRVPVRGGTDCTRDAYAVWTYLLHCAKDAGRVDRLGAREAGGR